MIPIAIRSTAIIRFTFPVLVALTTTVGYASDRWVRHRSPNRGTYQPPVIGKGGVEPVSVVNLDQGPPAKQSSHEASLGKLVEASVDEVVVADLELDATKSPAELPAPVVLSSHEETVVSREAVQHQVAEHESDHQSSIRRAISEHVIETCSCESCRAAVNLQTLGQTPMASAVFDVGSDAACCDSGFCDGDGCDSMGCKTKKRFGINSDSWFGSIELLLMFRKGDRLPPLATDGPLAANPGEEDTFEAPQVFTGGRNEYQRLTGGGRLTLGFWLDRYKDRHFVARGWFAGEENFDFVGNQNTHPTLVRPFFNVTDPDNPINDELIVATPDQASGELTVRGESNVYGADFSVRQLWYKGLGATIDVLYGYQYMGLKESLLITDRSTSLAQVPPIGSVRATTDSFEVENNFHGGQIGIATHYRESCWSFSSLFKLGFGSIQRRSRLSGQTFNSIDGNNAISPNGLLVRSTNEGTRSSSTFGWIPELDLTLGCKTYPSFDVTFGYHLVVMTDALRVSGAIDPELAVNVSEDPSDNPRPTAIYKDGSFYVHGIHFGLAYLY